MTMPASVLHLWAADARDTMRRQHARIAELEAQLEAIGAGGVEPLRPRKCMHQISEPTPRRTDWLEQLGFELREHGGVRIVVDDCGNEREATLTERACCGMRCWRLTGRRQRLPL